MRTCSRKGIIIYTKYAMFIKLSPTRFTIDTNNDTKTPYICVIYICGHLIQKRLLITEYNNIAINIIIIIIIQLWLSKHSQCFA